MQATAEVIRNEVTEDEARQTCRNAIEWSQEGNTHLLLAAGEAWAVRDQRAYFVAGYSSWEDFCLRGLKESVSAVNNKIRCAAKVMEVFGEFESASGIPIGRLLTITPMVDDVDSEDKKKELYAFAKNASVKEFELRFEKAPDGLVRKQYAFPEGGAETVTRAIAQAKKTDPDMSDSKALEMICADFLADPNWNSDS